MLAKWLAQWGSSPPTRRILATAGRICSDIGKIMTKSTYLALAGFLAITPTSFAALQCVPWEYARLKDAKQDDLVKLVCSSQKKAMENYGEAMDTITDGGRNWKAESDASTHAQEVCLDQAQQAITMLREKFGAKADCGAR
jgi:hypothetical protein